MNDCVPPPTTPQTGGLFHVGRILCLALLLALPGCGARDWVRGLGCSSGGPPELHQGLEAYNKGQWQEAASLLSVAVEKAPEDVSAWLYLGLATWKAGRQPEAKEHFEKVLDLDTSNEKALFYLAELSRAEGRLDEAEAYLRRGLASAPDSFAILNNLGLVSCTQGKYKEAVKFYTRALQQNDTSFVTTYNLGEAYRKSNQFQNAERIFRKALKLSPDSVFLAFSMAETLFALHKLEEALRFYGQILTSTQRFAQTGRVYFQLGVIHYLKEQFREARGFFDLAANEGFDRAQVLLWKAKEALRRSQHRDAIDYLREAEAIRDTGSAVSPGRIDYYLGVAHLGLDNPEEAIPCFKSALLFDLSPTRVLGQLGAAYLRIALRLSGGDSLSDEAEENLQHAQESFQQCLEDEKENLAAFMGISQVFFTRGDPKSALEWANKALAARRNFPPALLQSSLCHYSLRNTEAAIADLEAYLVAEPSNTDALFFLAQLHAQLEHYDTAVDLFRRGLVIEPANLDAMLLLSSVLTRLSRYKDATELLQRILDSDTGDLTVKEEARQLYAVVLRVYKGMVELTRQGPRARMGTKAYVDERLAAARPFIDRARDGPLSAEDREQLQELINRLILDYNYLSRNDLFETEDLSDRYREGVQQLVDLLEP